MLTAPEDIELRIRRVLSEWRPDLKFLGFEALTPDASLRRYFRVRLEGFPHGSLLCMWFDSVQSPEAAGASVQRSDDAYVELSHFFTEHKFAVPELYHDARKDALLFIEDLGDRNLASTVIPNRSGLARKSFLEAVDQLVVLQQIAFRKGFFPFERSFTDELYLREMGEFLEFLLQPKARTEDVKTLELAQRELAKLLHNLPRVLSHRDYHAWNLMLDPEERIRIIDFQDALLAPPAYDLVSLLNDRDMDEALGGELYRECLERFRLNSGFDAGFYRMYDQVLLQRDFKVAGRFEKLASVRGLENYRKWIPGTLRRIGATLERIVATNSQPIDFSASLEVLCRYFPEIRSGAARKLRFGSADA